jgi:hypothetical protein
MLNKYKLQLVTAVLLLATVTAFAEEGVKYDASDLYRAKEVDVDVFGTAAVGKYTIDHLSGNRLRHNSRLGAGMGVSYFFNRNVGISGDAYSENTSHSFVDSASANLVVRFPLGTSGFSPYVFGGGGYQFDAVETAFVQAGAGIEYRFNPHVGMFVDARGVLPDKTKYFGVGRLGMRFAF